MRCGHLLAADGVSGDLWLGTLVDAGAPLDALQAAVDALGVAPVRLAGERTTVHGLAATRVRVLVPDDAPSLPTWKALRGALGASALDDTLRARASAVLRRLGDAEAVVHGTDLAHVRFHELGHLDTLVDVVAAVAGLHELRLEAVTCGAVAVGAGTVRGHHGVLPVPPPAVTQLLRGFVLHGGGRDRELTTPTGAALLATLARPVDDLPPLRLERTARGATGPPDGPSTSVLTLLVGDLVAGVSPPADGPHTAR
ncbi:MAG TPA: LarC family nickel insertion protein [Nitriliruptorales bacterium]|nr:LarC family nickel insertion protein [Nitriliruptorales bacterium]